jgi:hypothetical protein
MLNPPRVAALGFDVRVAATGKEALRLLEQCTMRLCSMQCRNWMGSR